MEWGTLFSTPIYMHVSLKNIAYSTRKRWTIRCNRQKSTRHPFNSIDHFNITTKTKLHHQQPVDTSGVFFSYDHHWFLYSSPKKTHRRFPEKKHHHHFETGWTALFSQTEVALQFPHEAADATPEDLDWEGAVEPLIDHWLINIFMKIAIITGGFWYGILKWNQGHLARVLIWLIWFVNRLHYISGGHWI